MLRFPTTKQGLAGLILSVALAAWGPGHADGTAVNPYQPDPEAKDAPALQGSTWLEEGEGYAIRLQMIDDAERQAFILRSTGFPTDPFANRPGQELRFLSFLLEVENRTEGQIALNPMDCWLMTNHKKIKTPLGLTDLSFQYHIAGTDLPPAYENLGRILMIYPTALEPGQSLHGLLVYRAVEPNTKKFHVDVQLVLPNGDVVRFAAPYRRPKDKKH